MNDLAKPYLSVEEAQDKLRHYVRMLAPDGKKSLRWMALWIRDFENWPWNQNGLRDNLRPILQEWRQELDRQWEQRRLDKLNETAEQKEAKRKANEDRVRKMQVRRTYFFKLDREIEMYPTTLLTAGEHDTLVQDILRKTWDLYIDGTCWTQGALARDINNQEVMPYDPESVAWSIEGGVYRSFRDIIGDNYSRDSDLAYYYAIIAVVRRAGVRSAAELPDWNDAPDRTITDIRDVLMRAYKASAGRAAA